MWGEWIEMASYTRKKSNLLRLSPCGESGLKSKIIMLLHLMRMSLPVWGEWIEIRGTVYDYNEHVGLSPCGESGLK